MLVIKDLYSDISDCFWLFYGSKYKLCFRQYEMVHYLFCFEGLHLFISVRTLIYGANHSPKHEKRIVRKLYYIVFQKDKIQK